MTINVKTRSSALESCGLASIVGILLLLYIPVVYLVNGFVLTKLWVWFVTPVFDIRPLTLLETVGVGMVATFLTHQYYSTPSDKTYNQLSYAILAPIITLVIGFIIHSLM